MAEQQKAADKAAEQEQKAADKAAKQDKYKHEAIPGAKGLEAIGSGQGLPDAAVDAMSARLAANEPEAPKVGPIGNVDLYETPGGYQAIPAGMDVKQVGKVMNAVNPAYASGDVGESKQVAGPGSSPVSPS